jgi:hypothetical protein
MTNDEYLARLNEALDADPDFAPGMAFVHVPEGIPAERAQGYDWVKVDGKDGVYQRIVRSNTVAMCETRTTGTGSATP